MRIENIFFFFCLLSGVSVLLMNQNVVDVVGDVKNIWECYVTAHANVTSKSFKRQEEAKQMHER